MPRILSIDYGQKRTGIAVTDEMQIIASGLTTIPSATAIDFLKDYFSKEKVEAVLIGERNVILEQFTAFTYKMHEGKVNFLDHSPGNTLVVKKDSGKYDFYLIDLNRMKFEDLSIEARMDNFKKMWLSKTMVKVIAKAYAKLSNQSEEKLHAILLEKTTQFKRKITKKKYLKRKIGKK